MFGFNAQVSLTFTKALFECLLTRRAQTGFLVPGRLVTRRPVCCLHRSVVRGPRFPRQGEAVDAGSGLDGAWRGRPPWGIDLQLVLADTGREKACASGFLQGFAQACTLTFSRKVWGDASKGGAVARSRLIPSRGSIWEVLESCGKPRGLSTVSWEVKSGFGVLALHTGPARPARGHGLLRCGKERAGAPREWRERRGRDRMVVLQLALTKSHLRTLHDSPVL